MTKSILLFCTVMLVCVVCKGQLNKGSILLGGDLGISYQAHDPNTSENKASYFSTRIIPDAGYFIADNLAAGANIGYAYSLNTISYNGSDQRSMNNSFSAGPFIRWYRKLGERTALFTEMGAVYSYTMGDYSSTSSGLTNNSFISYESLSTGLTPGFTYFLSDKFALETTVGFIGYGWSKSSNGDVSGNYQASLNLRTSSMYIGFKYYLKKAGSQKV